MGQLEVAEENVATSPYVPSLQRTEGQPGWPARALLLRV